MKDLDKKRIDTIIRFALKEDIWTGDITSQSVVDRFLNVKAVIVAKEEGIVCGMDIIERVFSAVEYSLRFKPMVSDGEYTAPEREIAFIEGEAQAILKAERTALNFLSMLSGVATRTRMMVERVKGTNVKIYDTRKTIPLHRYLEKYAVGVGGGCNHRRGLWDMVLIKDNHLRSLAVQLKTTDTGLIVKEAIKRARLNVQKNIRIEIEVESLKEYECALPEKPDVIMLDNMTPELVKKAVALRKASLLEKEVLLEVSGGIHLDNIRGYAETGIDIISIGALTSSIIPINFGLEIICG